MDQRGRGEHSRRGKRNRGRGRGRRGGHTETTATSSAAPVTTSQDADLIQSASSAKPEAQPRASGSSDTKPEAVVVTEAGKSESKSVPPEVKPSTPEPRKSVSINLIPQSPVPVRKIAHVDPPSLPLVEEPTSSQGQEQEKHIAEESKDPPAGTEEATMNPRDKIKSAPSSRRGSSSLVLDMPSRIAPSIDPNQDPNFLTTPTTADAELLSCRSFSYPKSDSGSAGFNGKNRRLSGVRAEDHKRKVSIGLGGVPKKGYWGGMDDSSDSDDSLLAQTSSKRRKSGPFVLGPKLMGYNRRQWLILIVIAMVDFCSAVLISIQAPLYPREAISKGVNATTYGILFGVFELTIFLMSPTFYNLLRKVDMKVMFHFGIFTTGTSAILFSFLARIEDATLFVTCSFILRVFEAIGDASILTAAYAIVTLEFPDTVADTFTSLEVFLGIGFLVGPPLSGLLFESYGFMLPFFLFGILLISSGILSLSILPKFREDNASREVRKPAFLSLLQIPSVALAAFSILTATISLGFLNSSLYAHLTQFTLSASTIGAIFILNQGMYSLSAPFWNLFINRVSDPKYISILATLLIFIAYIFVGPVSLLPLDSNLEVTCTALALGGVALGGILVSAFIVIMKDTIEYGFPDNEATFGMSSGLYASFFAFGSFIGLSSSGILFDQVGFRYGLIFPLSVHILLATVTVLYMLFGPKTISPGYRSRHPSAAFQESEPLLGPSPELFLKSRLTPTESPSSSGAQPPPPPAKGSSYGTSTSYESIA